MRLLLAVLGLAVLIWAGLCALMYLQQRTLIYLPQFTFVPADQTSFELQRGDGIVLRGWHLPADGRAVVIYFGGNAEAVQWLLPHAGQLFPDHDLYLLPYRGYGASDGQPSQQLLFDDAVALYDHIRSRHPQAPIHVVGRSLGSGVGAWLAGQRRVDRLVLVSAFDSLMAVARHHYPWLPVRWLLRERYESAHHLAGHDGPVLASHARADAIIPAARSQALVDTLPRPSRVRVLPGSDHNFDLLEPELAQAIAGFLTAPEERLP